METWPGCLVYRPRGRPHSHCGLPLCVVDAYPRSTLEHGDPSWSMLDRCLVSLPGAAGGLTGLAVSKARVCIFLGMGSLLMYSSGLWVWEHGGQSEVPTTPFHFLPLLRGGSGSGHQDLGCHRQPLKASRPNSACWVPLHLVASVQPLTACIFMGILLVR